MRSIIGMAALTASSFAAAQPSPADLPDGEALVRQMRERVGGEAIAAHHNVRMHGTVVGPDDGRGYITEVYGGFGKSRVTTEFTMVGTFELGSDGQTVWERSPLGITAKEGWAASEFLRRAGFAQHLDWFILYTKVKCVGIEEIDGHSCYKLHLFPKELVPMSEREARQVPPPDEWYLDVQTLLPRRTQAKTKGNMGEPTTIRFDLSDWRAVDGVQYAHAMQMDVGGLRLSVNYRSFEHNVKLPDDFFGPDEEVKAALNPVKTDAAGGGMQDLRLETLTERHIAAIRVTCKQEELQRTLAVVLPEVFRHVNSVGATTTGPPLVRHHQWAAQVDLEAAIPIAEPTEAKGRVKPQTLPAGLAVVAWHVGPYEDLGNTHEKVKHYLEANELEVRDAPWEEYWTDPGLEPDPSKWRTKVIWPVKKK